ncbi:flavodoxin domain-containing protein [Streptomyces sp. Da 82-17]|uniref:flavodoxin domain-containing protein n=1 Tax=Streptomyces sp. Da 82-17 TaxID=3377116 RepID=UPI0038D49F4D
MTVLVAYASAYGSTRSIARRLASRLAEDGVRAEARDVESVHDLEAYEAYVVGSAVHGQAWLEPARRFVDSNLGVLKRRPVWVFSVGMPGALRGPWKRLAPKEAPKLAESLPPAVEFHDHRLFSGVVARPQLPRAARLLFRLMGGRFGDFRDWAAVDAWADEIAHELARGGARHGVPEP